MLTDNSNLSSSQPHHHITDEAKEIKGHGSPLYLSQWHCLVYREEIMQVFLWSNLFFFCFNTLRYTGWRMGTNLRSTEIGYDWLQCVPLIFALFHFTSAFWIFYLNIRLQPGAAKPLWPAERAGIFFNQPLAFECFHSYQLLGIPCKIIFLLHVSVSTWSLFKYQNIESPKETEAVMHEFGGISVWFPRQVWQLFLKSCEVCTGCALLHSLKHNTADKSRGNCTGSWEPETTTASFSLLWCCWSSSF